MVLSTETQGLRTGAKAPGPSSVKIKVVICRRCRSEPAISPLSPCLGGSRLERVRNHQRKTRCRHERFDPAWAGGLPADAPPRPGTAKYDEYMQERERKRLMP